MENCILFYQKLTYGGKKPEQSFVHVQREMNIACDSSFWDPLDLMNDLHATQLLDFKCLC